MGWKHQHEKGDNFIANRNSLHHLAFYGVLSLSFICAAPIQNAKHLRGGNFSLVYKALDTYWTKCTHKKRNRKNPERGWMYLHYKHCPEQTLNSETTGARKNRWQMKEKLHLLPINFCRCLSVGSRSHKYRAKATASWSRERFFLQVRLAWTVDLVCLFVGLFLFFCFF